MAVSHLDFWILKTHFRRLRPPAWLASLFALVLALSAQGANAGTQSVDPPSTSPRSIADLIRLHPDETLHIVFIHGIRTDARGSSLTFQSHLCDYIPGGCRGPTRSTSTVLYLGPWPRQASYVGHAIWKSDDEWNASQPFVDHYVYERGGGRPRIIVDEINWWPLVFPIKCREIVQGDTGLAGPDQRTIDLCANLTISHGQAHQAYADHYPWISPSEADALVGMKPNGGGAAWANRLAKTEILDWGLSDAVISLGVTKVYLRRTVQCALNNIAEFDPESAPRVTVSPATSPMSATAVICANEAQPTEKAQFALVSHSLGSFIMLDTFAAAAGRLLEIDDWEQGRPSNAEAESQAGQELCAADQSPRTALLAKSVLSDQKIATAERERAEVVAENRGLCFVLRNSSSLYLFANQFPLLEIGRIQGLSNPPLYGVKGSGAELSSAASGESAEPPRLGDALGAWASVQSADPIDRGIHKQVVAFNDPSDILTYPIPCIDNAVVVNIPVHNATDWLHLFERPDAAHVGYFSNPQVLKTMFKDNGPSGLSNPGSPADVCESLP